LHVLLAINFLLLWQ